MSRRHNSVPIRAPATILEVLMENPDVTQQGGQSARFKFTKETLRTLYSSVQRPGGSDVKAEDTSPSTSDTCNTSDNCCCCVIAL